MTPVHADRLRTAGQVAVLCGVAAIVSSVAVWAPADRVTAVSWVLGAAAVVAGLLVAGEHDGLSVSGSFIVLVLAAVFLGPRSAILAALIAEAAAALRLRTRLRLIVVGNIAPSVVPAVAAWLLIDLVRQHASSTPAFFGAVGGASLLAITVSFFLFAGIRRLAFPALQQFGLRTFLADLPSIALNVALVVAGAAITVKLGTAGIAFALAAVMSFSYMSHLLAEARERSRQHVSLSWGVLAGLIRAMNMRDPRAARHAAAVARFARDIARAVGMSEREIELAHTAGLLHDVGHFALSDRVAERGRPLTDEDWQAIERHPELGADLLRDLGMYGPVAQIVRAHHERIDGRGYPDGLTGDEIPEIAKIVSVAEVYDTLTASDTYRTPVSSFEAIRELRRVAGTQLESRYVEALASLLAGEGLSYRHADSADFDRELDMERRIKEAAAGA